MHPQPRPAGHARSHGIYAGVGIVVFGMGAVAFADTYSESKSQRLADADTWSDHAAGYERGADGHARLERRID